MKKFFVNVFVGVAACVVLKNNSDFIYELHNPQFTELERFDVIGSAATHMPQWIYFVSGRP